MAGVTGLEPATSGVTGQRSNQLSYTPVLSDQIKQLIIIYITFLGKTQGYFLIFVIKNLSCLFLNVKSHCGRCDNFNRAKIPSLFG